MAKSKATFDVYYTLNLEVSTEIQAESLEEAIEIGRRQRVPDLIAFDGSEWIDGDLKLSGAHCHS